MRITSDGEIELCHSHTTENYACFIGNRHGKKFKIYLNMYDIGQLAIRYNNRLLRTIISVDDDNVEQPKPTSWQRIEKSEEDQKHFRNQQLDLLQQIVINTKPKPTTKRANRKN